MNVSKKPPKSVFNTNSDFLVEFLESECEKHCQKEVKPESKLHLHQIEAVLSARKYFSDLDEVEYMDDGQQDLYRTVALVVLPTGCGKTGVAVLASYALNASRVLVITPSLIISKQICAAYEKFLIDYGVIKPKDLQTARQNVIPQCALITKSRQIRNSMNAPVMVVNAHKIGGRSSIKLDDVPSDGYDLVIVDEAHHYPAPTWRMIVDRFYKSKRLFLTATPEYKGDPILPEVLPCYELKRKVAIEKGIIRDVCFEEMTGGQDNEHKYSVS